MGQIELNSITGVACLDEQMDGNTTRWDVGVTRWTSNGKDADAGRHLCNRLCDKFILHTKL